MGDDGRGKRSRVTLKFDAQPLALPGESPDEADDESVELRLPTSEELEAAERLSSIPPAGEVEGRDGWERQRRSVTPPPTAYDLDAPEGDGVEPPGALPTVGDALALVDSRSRPPPTPANPEQEMADRFALGDFTAALRLAELILGNDPRNTHASETARVCRDKLVQLYLSRLGALSRRPRRAVKGADVRWLGLDHREGFVLSHIDGGSSIEELVDVAGMPRIEVLKTLVELLDVGAIRFDD